MVLREFIGMVNGGLGNALNVNKQELRVFKGYYLLLRVVESLYVKIVTGGEQ